MKILQNLGLVALLGLAPACSESPVKRNENLEVKKSCIIEYRFLSSGTVNGRSTHAVDTNGDGQFDEAFATEGYLTINPSDYQANLAIARATTHYVAPGITESEQTMTGFPHTVQMSPEYRAALRLLCNGQE